MRLYIGIFLLAMTFSNLYGQEREAFRISNLMVSLTEKDSVEVVFSITAISKNATRKGELIITPTIFNDQNKASLQSLYATKQYGWLARLLRGKKTIPHSLIPIHYGVSTYYSASLPFQEWMHGAKMKIEFSRERRPAEYFSPQTLQTNLVLERTKVKTAEERKKAWMSNEEIEFLFYTNGLDPEITEAIISANYSAAINILLRMEGNAIVWNALGVAYGYNAEYEKARIYFEKAATSGQSIATMNINELNKKVIPVIIQ